MHFVAFLFLFFQLFSSQFAEYTDLENYLNDQNIVMVVYGVEWCRFSSYMREVVKETNEKLSNMTLNDSVKIINFDCVANDNICTRVGIFKYPTSFIYSRGVKITEYTEERSAEAIIDKLEEMVKDKSILIRNEQELDELKRKGENFVIGFFSQTSLTPISLFVGHLTQFYVASNIESEMHNGESIRYYTAKDDTWTYFQGELTDYKKLGDWISQISREKIVYLNFRNAEKIVSTGLPLFVFLLQDQKPILDLFAVQFDAILHIIKDRVNFVYVNCDQFKHALYYFGKTEKDCPLFMIDSLSHIFLFPGDIEYSLKTDMNSFVEFINDFFSEKLHKKLHHIDVSEDPESENVFKNSENLKIEEPLVKESKFKALAPSSDRYSFKDEL